jgi:transposase-like protein
MGGESTEAWRTVLDDLVERGLRRSEFLIVDGTPGLENAIAAVWTAFRSSAVRSTNIAICWRMHPNACMRRSRPTTTA